MVTSKELADSDGQPDNGMTCELPVTQIVIPAVGREVVLPDERLDILMDGEMEDLREDFGEARLILKQCAVLLCFLGDEDFAKVINKGHRKAMERMADKIDAYLDNMDIYNEEEDEDDGA